MTARAIVGFRNGRYLGSRLLRPHFRHAAAAVPDGDMWVVVDHQSDTTIAQCSPSADDFFQGWPVVITCLAVERNRSCLPLFRPQTCVEAVKRLLHVDDRLIFTPYQLYRYLMRCRDGRHIWGA